MKTIIVTALIIVTGLLSGLACIDDNRETTIDIGEPTVTPTSMPTMTVAKSPTPEPVVTVTPTQTPAPTPTKPPSQCEMDEIAIQVAIDSYYSEYSQWPTADGQSGEIVWDNIIPNYMDAMPYANNKCQWAINSDPEGFVCMGKTC